MDYEELLSFLDIEDPSELVYFEQFAELIEASDDISLEAIKQLIDGIDEGGLAELTEGYFDDLLRFVPDEEAELYTLLQAIGTTLTTLAQNEEPEETDSDSLVYADELYKFRNWYIFDSCVISVDREEGAQTEIPLMEALTNYRVRNFVEDEYQYDFSNALDYPLDEYIVSLSSISDDDDEDDDDEDEDDNVDIGFDDNDDDFGFDDDDDDLGFDDVEFDDDLDFSEDDDDF